MERSILATPRDQPAAPRRPLTHYHMEWANILKAASLVGILGFLTSVGCSFVLAFCISDTFLCFVFGIILCGCSFISFILAFALHSTFFLRFLVFAVGVFSAGGGILLLLIDPNYHLKASYFNRAAIYFYIILPCGLLLTAGWLVVTRPALGLILQASKIERSEELMLYFCVTFVASVGLAGVFPAVPGVTVVELSSNALMWAIAVWFFAGIVSAAMGILIERRGDKALAGPGYELQPATSRPSHLTPSHEIFDKIP
jgi:hypothetical protein